MSSEDRRQLIEDEMERIADEMERMAAGFEILVVREGHVMGGTIPDAGEESHASEIGHENAVAEGVSAMQESTEADGGQEDHTDDTDTANPQASTPTAADASDDAENHQAQGPTMTVPLPWTDPYAGVVFSFEPDTTVILGPDDLLVPLFAPPPEWVAEQEREMAEVRRMSEVFTWSLPTGRHATFEYFMRVQGLTQGAPVASSEGAVDEGAADEGASEESADEGANEEAADEGVSEEVAEEGASSGQGLSAQEEYTMAFRTLDAGGATGELRLQQQLEVQMAMDRMRSDERRFL